MEVNETVTAMIAPALFLTATGSLLISTSNRIARIVDRIRALVTQCESGEFEQLDFPELRRQHALQELRQLQIRSNRVAIAVTMLYMAFTAFAGTSLTIGLRSITGGFLESLPAVLAVAGVTLLFIACIFLVLEARSSLRGNDRELRFFYELEARRGARPTETSASDEAQAGKRS
ncbi:MAG: DUF2721 domain-containing protein [Planctomycetes bacterium]|nr:DUF2721 domain-containing protein [Planctomycetota bacterium]